MGNGPAHSFRVPWGLPVIPEWFYSVGDTRQGPVSDEQLRELAADGTLKAADLVWKDGMPDWVEARTIPGLFPVRDDLRKSKPPREADDAEVVEDRPRRRRRRFDEEDDRPRPRRDSRDSRDDDRDDYDDARRGPRRRGAKPSQISTVAVLMLVGGILGLLYAVILGPGSAFLCCLSPFLYFELVVGILMIVRATNMMNQDDYGPPTGLAVCQICFILNGDPVNLTLGIIALVMLNSDEAKAYYRRRGF